MTIGEAIKYAAFLFPRGATIARLAYVMHAAGYAVLSGRLPADWFVEYVHSLGKTESGVFVNMWRVIVLTEPDISEDEKRWIERAVERIRDIPLRELVAGRGANVAQLVAELTPRDTVGTVVTLHSLFAEEYPNAMSALEPIYLSIMLAVVETKDKELARRLAELFAEVERHLKERPNKPLPPRVAADLKTLYDNAINVLSS